MVRTSQQFLDTGSAVPGARCQSCKTPRPESLQAWRCIIIASCVSRSN